MIQRKIRRNRFRRIIDGGQSYSQRLNAIPGINWWHKQELTGTTIFNTDPALNGVYTAVALGQPAQGDLGYGVGYDGLVSFGNIYSLALNTFFNPTAGTIVAFVKVANAGVWTDGTDRAVATLLVDAGNQVQILKRSTNNRLQLFYVAGGVTKVVTINGLTSTDYLMFALTWDTVADEAIAYLQGIQSGATQTGLGVWVGNLAATATVIGAGATTPNSVWDGDITRVGIANRALSAIEIWNIWQGSGLA